MQSLRLLHDLNAFSSSNTTARSPRAIRQTFEDGEEYAIPIAVTIFPSTSLESGEVAEEESKENLTELAKEKPGNSPPNTFGQIGCVKDREEVEIAKNISDGEKEEEKRMDWQKSEEEEEAMEGEEGEGEEVEEREYTAEELARWARRRLFPTETIHEICQFLPFGDCNRQYTTCRMLHALLEPRRKVCMEVFIKRLDDAREKLNKTIQENLKDVDERRRHVHELSEHIGTINARLADMGEHLAELDAQILENHSKLNELHERIERIKAPMPKKGDK